MTSGEIIVYSTPLIGGAIGWFTNYIAIKMLFHPQEPLNLGFTQIQGVFPKRKPLLAERLGKIVGKELFSVEVIKAKLDTPETRGQLKVAITDALEDYLKNKFKASNPMLGMLLTDSVIAQVKEKLAEQLDSMIDPLMQKLNGKLDEINIEQIVYEKVYGFSNDQLEALLMSVINKELRFVEIAGGVLGFVIGLVQMAIFMAAR